MASFTLVCSECTARYGERDVRYVCPACAREQMPGGSTRGVLHVELDRLPDRYPDRGFADLHTLVEWLPIDSAERFPPLPVGGTPLLPAPRLRDALGMPRLWIKDDSRNPSGSAKDRASMLVVAKAREYGFDTIACASTGNAASALACLAAASGVGTVVFVPAAAPHAKLVQIASYGARLIRVDGSYDDAFELSLAACQRFGWYNRNTAFNPFTIEGKKSAALEIAAQLAPERPDAVLVPVGDGVIIAGIAKGFADLAHAGILDRVPRLIAVQPEGSSAIARALRDGADEATPHVKAASIADSLVVAAPRNGAMALAEVRASGGGGVIVTDEAIIAAIGRLAATTGLFAEPAAAAVLAGLDAALAEGLVERDERVVLLVTGSGLKDVPAAARGIRLPDPVAAHLASL
jgi:threonine synthase